MADQLIQAVILGIVQGLTEFLPVSSSGHLVLTTWLFRWNDLGLSFDVALHGGTLLAVLLYFRREWVRIIGGLFAALGIRDGTEDDHSHGRLALLMVLASIPAAIAGFLGEDLVEGYFRDPMKIALLLMVTGALLFLAEWQGKRAKDMAGLRVPDAITIGLFQALALLPGVSRSGATIAAGLLRGLTREAAARFSFMLAAPIMLGAELLEMLKVMRNGSLQGEPLVYLVGFVVATMVALACIKFFLALLRRSSLAPMIGYCFVIGPLVLVARLLGY